MNGQLLENKEISVHDFLVQSQYVVEPDFEEEIIPRKIVEAHRARMNTYYKIFSLLFFFGLWQLISYLNSLNEWFNPVFLPSPAMVIETAYDYIIDGTLIGHIGMSFYRMIVGFVIGVVIAVVLGILIATKRDFDNIFTPILNLVGPIPVFAFLPMFLIWFGIGESSKIALIAYATFVPLITYVIDGIKNTDPVLIRSARSLGATPFQVFTKVIFKSAMPHIFAGMKISLALTFSALVVAEMMGASEGLGYIIVNAKNWFKMADMFLAATLIGLEYTIFYGILTLIEKRLFRWKKVGMSKAVEN
ncbi:nitrate ABC transporter permease [Megamonas hypermegale]|uniref:ABC transporter permease n=1 Tax=Megamonas hypermegale TaxID=158847 RepID=UPI000B37C78E|nr:ABC transporter permease [Megamonas hypermegale]MBM6761047.1 ABC transporter permease [Megamonas hypermegale]OUO39962.1 nitrate ABC transporter permease [Megamonas hypermegale]